MSSLKSPAPTLAELRRQIKDLDAVLQPVLSAPLDSLTSGLEKKTERAKDAAGSSDQAGNVVLSGRLQSAQLQSSLTYVLLDLIWILLKVNGTETQTHPVTSELKRVQQYLEKVHKIDRSIVAARAGSRETTANSASPAIDKEKASRFIKGALGAVGKRTIFADDGSVETILAAGEPKASDERAVEQSPSKGDNGSSVAEPSGQGNSDDEGWSRAASKRAKREQRRLQGDDAQHAGKSKKKKRK